MRFVKRGVALAMLAALSVASLPAQAYQQDKTYKITILHTNDHHGHFWRSEYGEYGLAAQKTLVDGIRKEVAAEGGSVLLLSGGDINTGVPESDLQDAEPDFRGMNLVGYDAMAVGNHEFDNPMSVLRQQEKWAKHGFGWWALLERQTGAFVGAACLQHLGHIESNPLEIGWRLIPPAQGKGYATEAGQGAKERSEKRRVGEKGRSRGSPYH